MCMATRSRICSYLVRDGATLRGFLWGLPNGVNVLAGSLSGVAISDRELQPHPLSKEYPYIYGRMVPRNHDVTTS